MFIIFKVICLDKDRHIAYIKVNIKLGKKDKKFDNTILSYIYE